MKPRYRTLDSYTSQPGGLTDSFTAESVTSVDATSHAEQERPHQLDFMRAIISNLGEGTYAVNRSGQVTFMNPAAERMLGWIEGELLGKDMHETIHFQHADGTPFPKEQCPLLGVIRSGEAVRVDDDVFTRKDGVTISVAYVGSPLITDGAVTGAVVAFQEISERKRLEKALRRSQQDAAAHASQLEAIFESMADAVLFYDREGQAVQANRAFRRLLAVDARPDYFALPLEERGRLLHARDAGGQPLAEAQWLPFRVLRGEVLTSKNADDFLIRALDGRDVLLNGSGAPVRDAEGSIVGGVLILHDVTERRRQEQRTHEVLDGLLAMAEALVANDPESDPTHERAAATAGMAQRLADLTWTVLGCQRVTIVPVGPADEVQQTWAVAGPITAEESQQWQAEWPQAGQRHLQDFLPSELIARLNLGELIPIDLMEPPFNRWPNPLAWRSRVLVPMLIGRQLIGILTLDYGADLRMVTPDELALAGGVARLAGLVLERERLLWEREAARASALALTEANRRMDEFLGIATHELKTPVTSSSLCVELATDSLTRVIAELAADRDKVARTLQPIHGLMVQADAGIERLSRLMADLLDVARIRAGKLEFRLARCDLAAVVRDAVTEQRQITPGRTITLHGSARRTISVWADAERIGQVVTNFLTNALKYSPEDCPVTVGVRVHGGWARVSVRDAGIGISPEEQESIWQRFRRVEGVQVQSGTGVGLGLGLYIARTAIERNSGQIGVHSAPGKGSTFWFALPVERRDV